MAESAIGYAGLKDRHAVTRQRVSVWIPKKIAPDIATLQSDELKVLAHAWHSRKLPRGALAGNRFVLTLREVEGDAAAIEARLQAIAARGVPNYFGEQRFGRGGRNLDKALAMFAGRRVPREERTHLLSAARSELFNRALAARVEAGNWNAALEGEVWMLDGSRSVFGPEAFGDELKTRREAFDIHPTGPLWGEGELRSSDQARELELAAMQGDTATRLRDGLERAGLKQERRALRLRPESLEWRWLDDAALELRFALPPGCYATTVLRELGFKANTVGYEPELAVQTYNTAGNWKDLDMIKRARNEAKREGITIREVNIATVPQEQLKALSEKWIGGKKVNDREIWVYARRPVYAHEQDVRKFVAFDKDGTLIDLDAAWGPAARAWVETAARGDVSLMAELAARMGLDLDRDHLVTGGLFAVGTLGQLHETTLQIL